MLIGVKMQVIIVLGVFLVILPNKGRKKEEEEEDYRPRSRHRRHRGDPTHHTFAYLFFCDLFFFLFFHVCGSARPLVVISSGFGDLGLLVEVPLSMRIIKA
jgi:hypothetical protein